MPQKFVSWWIEWIKLFVSISILNKRFIVSINSIAKWSISYLMFIFRWLSTLSVENRVYFIHQYVICGHVFNFFDYLFNFSHHIVNFQTHQKFSYINMFCSVVVSFPLELLFPISSIRTIPTIHWSKQCLFSLYIDYDSVYFDQ